MTAIYKCWRCGCAATVGGLCDLCKAALLVPVAPPEAPPEAEALARAVEKHARPNFDWEMLAALRAFRAKYPRQP